MTLFNIPLVGPALPVRITKYGGVEPAGATLWLSDWDTMSARLIYSGFSSCMLSVRARHEMFTSWQIKNWKKALPNGTSGNVSNHWWELIFLEAKAWKLLWGEARMKTIFLTGVVSLKLLSLTGMFLREKKAFAH